MKRSVLFIGMFLAFFSSCNLFTLTGAQTEVDDQFFATGGGSGEQAPIITQSTNPLMTSADCTNGHTFTLYGANFDGNTNFYYKRLSDGVIVQYLTVNTVSSTMADVSLSAALAGSIDYILMAEKNGLESAAGQVFGSCT